MTIVHDLALLLIDPVGGRPARDRALRDDLIAGAVLAELALRGRVGLSAPEDGGALGRVMVHDATPTGDDLLDDALAAIHTEQWRRPREVVRVLARRGPWDAAVARLVEGGTLRAVHTTAWRVFPRTRWSVVDAARRDALGRRLRAVVADGAEPDDRTAALVGLLTAGGLRSGQVVDVPSRLEADRRAREVSVGVWAAEAVREHRAAGAVAVG